MKTVMKNVQNQDQKPQLVSWVCPSRQFWIIYSIFFKCLARKGFAFLNKIKHLGNSEAYCANGSLDSFLCRSGIVYNEGGPCKNMLGCLKFVLKFLKYVYELSKIVLKISMQSSKWVINFVWFSVQHFWIQNLKTFKQFPKIFSYHLF